MRVDSDDDFDPVDDYDMLDSADELVDENGDTPGTSPPASTTLPRCRQKNLQCPYEGCDKAFNRQARLQEHIRSHTNERPFKCPYSPCTKDFLRDSHLKHHIKSVHEDIRDYKCSWEGCDASFATGTRLRRHIQTHEAKEKFRCRGYEGCSQTFRKQETLDRHIKTDHLGIKPFPCQEADPVTGLACTKAYDTAEKLRAHQRARHDSTRFSCDECMRQNAETLANSADVDPDTLPVVSFATYGEFQAHLTIVHPPTCGLCPTSFTTNKELTRHLEIQHGILPESTSKPSQTFPCTHDGCDKQFTKRGNLNVHIRTVHENKRDFVCGQTEIALPEELADKDNIVIHGCNRSFTSKATLEEHVRSAHLGLEAKRVARNKKRKAEREAKELATGGRVLKKRKPRSDKGIKKTSVMADLIGQAHSESIAIPGAESASNDADSTHQADMDVDDHFLTGSMVMCGDQIYHYGSSYHYPSGEYPTIGDNASASIQGNKHDANTDSNDTDIAYGEYLPDTAMDYEVDDLFGFEQDHQPYFTYPAPSSY
ncbi:hypothetical protein PV08_00704 [Exophiala spinifera]|uniref:C2H2-type domain-containing protein n=1 Tax=Exophiala spinifera TaxID=91928 RepID=A0A0D2C983_9EURO|nr:uncharacterized protein PV08_00704 [Exophiala spinifera]KIW20129.1 hypothetical protein PV08_00704 [Exophiala spinifera]